jgi:hypothetical protein
MRINSAGECLDITSQHHWLTRVVEEGVAGQLVDAADDEIGIQVIVEASHEPFDTKGWEVLTRDSWRRSSQVVLRNACSSGLDLLVTVGSPQLHINARWRPELKVRGAAMIFPSRARLLIRSVLLQFPALWWSQQRGRAPLHASTCTVGQGGPTVLIAGPGGVGKSTLVEGELSRGASSTSDNLCVSDGFTVWGLLEPRRVPVGGSLTVSGGRRMPHGRREAPWSNRVEALSPDLLLVLRRNTSRSSAAAPCDSRDAARFLTAGTYMAGELRRYWSFAATLSLGTGLGEVHPPVERVANALSSRLPCVDFMLGNESGTTLEEIVNSWLVRDLK